MDTGRSHGCAAAGGTGPAAETRELRLLSCCSRTGAGLGHAALQGQEESEAGMKVPAPMERVQPRQPPHPWGTGS